MLDADNRASAARHGVVVWLQAPPAVLGARVADQQDHDGPRPLLAGGDQSATLERLAALRAPAYEAAAHVRGRHRPGARVDEVVDAVLEELASRTE